MGVWIETLRTWVTGQQMDVTPCMGVWIETFASARISKNYWVTPCMGVWIETSYALCAICRCRSHPVWVCGLKHHVSS